MIKKFFTMPYLRAEYALHGHTTIQSVILLQVLYSFMKAHRLYKVISQETRAHSIGLC